MTKWVTLVDVLEKYYDDIENVEIKVNNKEVEKVLYIEMNNGKNKKLRTQIEQELQKGIDNKKSKKCKLVM